MSHESRNGRLQQGDRLDKSHAGSGDKANPSRIPPARRWGMPNFCGPCGRYHSRDYEDCERRHRYAADVGNWGGYDARDLGLEPHDRRRCRDCRAVGR